MSAVSGPTPMSTTATATTAANPENNSNKANNMSSSSVVTETAARINGSSQPSSAMAEATAPVPTAETLSSSVMDVRSSNNTTSTSETKEEPRAGGSSSAHTAGASSDGPLPADLKRILAEVARTGSCSWLPWNYTSFCARGKAPLKGTATTDTSGAATAAYSAGAAGGVGGGGGGGIAVGKSSPPFAAAHAASLAGGAQQSTKNRRPYNANRLGIGPPRKKHRNGVKLKSSGHKGGGGGHSSSRKRPLFLIRTSAAAAAAQQQGGQAVGAPGSVGSSAASGRTSGSEPDDSTQYECDSEGTSATSCSELSTERNHLRNNANMQRVTISGAPGKNKQAPGMGGPGSTTSSQGGNDDHYRCLKDVFRMALGLVLDHWYRHRGGYKLSPAEKRRRSQAPAAETTARSDSSSASASTSALVNGHTTSAKKAPPHPTAAESKAKQQQQHSESSNNKSTAKEPPTTKEPKAEEIFQQRRQRLLMMLGQQGSSSSSKSSRRNPSGARRYQGEDEGPPFTIQRIAEVLIAPERYYTQTHKLCNCLEKLLLVTSSTSAFGGSTGGITSQSRLEERELAALANEKGRLESEFRQRALKRRNSSMSDDLQIDGGADAASRTPGSPSRDEGPGGADVKSNSPSPEKNKPDHSDPAGSESSSSREMLEAAARQLRTKFDHVGIDPHSSAVANRDVRSIAENRGMTNSPPPPSLAMSAAAASNIPLPGHSAVGNFVARQHHPPGEQNVVSDQHHNPNIARVPSPILFSQQGNESSSPMAPLHAPPNMHLLHMHHAAPLAGVSVGSTPFDVVTIEAGGSGHHATAPTSTNLPGSNEGADLEGRSSASNSDVDSESDDVSFDDSASDRSDGSDSGHYEPFTAARAMALNRIQQQQRLQSRGGVLTSLALHQSEGLGAVGGSGGGNIPPTRPPADSEYQSGDSIDSTRGEDSGGSDSSSSDLAD